MKAPSIFLRKDEKDELAQALSYIAGIFDGVHIVLLIKENGEAVVNSNCTDLDKLAHILDRAAYSIRLNAAGQNE